MEEEEGGRGRGGVNRPMPVLMMKAANQYPTLAKMNGFHGLVEQSSQEATFRDSQCFGRSCR